MSWVHARIIVKSNGEVHFSNDSQRGYMSVKEFIECYNGNMFISDKNDWIALDKRQDDLYIDFGEPAG